MESPLALADPVGIKKPAHGGLSLRKRGVRTHIPLGWSIPESS